MISYGRYGYRRHARNNAEPTTLSIRTIMTWFIDAMAALALISMMHNGTIKVTPDAKVEIHAAAISAPQTKPDKILEITMENNIFKIGTTAYPSLAALKQVLEKYDTTKVGVHINLSLDSHKRDEISILEIVKKAGFRFIQPF
jgi:biopolymer transport protein ExbD